MRQIKEDLKNNLFILRCIKEAGKISFVVMLYNVFSATLSYYVGTNIGAWVIDSVNSQSIVANITMIVGIYIMLYIARLLLRQFNMYVQPKASINVSNYLMRSLIKKTFEIRQQEVDSTEFYDKYTRAISEVATRPGEVLSLLENIVGGFIQIFTVVLIVSRLDISFTIVFVSAALVSTFITVFINQQEFNKYMESTKINRRLGYVNRVIYQREFGPLLRTNVGFKDILINRYDDGCSDLVMVLKKYHKKIYFLYVINEIFNYVFFGMIPWIFSAVGLISGKLSFGEVTIVMGATEFIPEICDKLFGSIVAIRKESMYIANLREVLEYKTVRPIEGNSISTAYDDKLIEAKHISFSYYSNKKKMVIKDVSLTVNKGEKLLLVGPNGAGKSSLAHIIGGLYSPTEGHVFLEGNDMEKYDFNSLNNEIITINQDAIMLSISVAENILQRPIMCIDDYEIVANALKKVNMYDRVMALKNGMDTCFSREFDEDGFVFSGGELQKLAIARVLESSAKIVIMDEPTSALDAISEAEIVDLLFSLLSERTLIIISHRLTFSKLATRICYIEDGKIAETGSHDELMQRHGLYYALYHTQADKYLN